MPALGGDARAHALAQRYDLPLPLGYFLAASGAVVVMTFVILALFWRAQRQAHRSTRRYDPARDGPRFGRGRLADAALSSLLTLLIAAGLFGNPATFKNITPVAVWVIWWVGFGFLTAFVGNIWPLINPWSSVFGFVETLARSVDQRTFISLHIIRDGSASGRAVVLFLLFAWLELVAPGRDVPRNIAIAILIYSAFTWAGFAIFGRDTWLKRGEVFCRCFRPVRTICAAGFYP